MSLRKKSNACFSLAQMVAAGMPIIRATRTAGAGTRGPIGRTLVRMSGEIEKGGMLLADAMRKHPHVFTPMDVMVVEVADNYGNLPEGLRMLANWYELMGRIKRIILTGMIMPLVTLNVAAFVFPLPALVTSGFDFSQYLRTVAMVLAAFYVPILTLAFLISASGSRGRVRKAVDHVAFYVPMLGGALRAMALSRYCMAFGMMARSGVSVITTAERSAELCGNAVMEKRLAGGAVAARQGNPVVEGFSKRLPFEFVEMWRVGEETGDMGSMTSRMAKTYEEQMVWGFTALARGLPWVLYGLVSIAIVIMIFKLMGFYLGMLTSAGSID
jgi:type IV pilus assembly protein PilC